MNVPAPLISACVLLLAPAAGAPGGDVRFQAQPLRGGERLGLSMSSEMAVRIEVTVNGESQDSVDLLGSIALSCVASVAEADEDGCTSATLAFGKAAEVEADRLGERPTARVPDYANRNYDVTRARAGFEITGARGDLSEREKQVTKAIAESTLGLPPLGKFLDGRTLRQGQRIDVPVEVGAKLLGLLASDVDVQSLDLTFRGMRREGFVELAIFAATAKLETTTTDGVPMHVEVDLEGEFAVASASGLVVALDLNGPVTLTGRGEQEGSKIELDGKGKWAIQAVAKLESE